MGDYEEGDKLIKQIAVAAYCLAVTIMTVISLISDIAGR